MRIQPTTALLLAASCSPAATYVNDFGAADPSLQVSTAVTDRAWDPTATYNSFNYTLLQKPWDVSVGDGNVTISGWATMPSSYFETYPTAADNTSLASFVASTSFGEVASFKISDISSLSYRVTVGNLHAVPQEMAGLPPYIALFLLTGDGTRTYIYGGEADIVVTRSGVGETGDYLFTYSNFLADPNDLNYVGIGFLSGAYWDYTNWNAYPDQFVDLTFQSTSITLGPVPEPSTYGLILGGLALAGAAIRRRKAKQA